MITKNSFHICDFAVTVTRGLGLLGDSLFLMAFDGEEIRLQLWKNSKSLYESVFFIASIVVLSSIQVPQNDEPFRPSYRDTQS